MSEAIDIIAMFRDAGKARAVSLDTLCAAISDETRREIVHKLRSKLMFAKMGIGLPPDEADQLAMAVCAYMGWDAPEPKDGAA